MRRVWCWALMSAAMGCDDGADGPSPSDAVVMDATPGSDAMVPDAAPASDARVVDAMPTPDAIAIDAALPDAAPTDAALPDVGVADASRTDAAPDLDAAPADAIAPDTALPDMAPDMAAQMPDAAPAIDVGPVDAGPGPIMCGEQRLPTAQIRGTEGLTIAADGTAYYSQSRAVGRRVPGAAPENGWVALPAAGTVWGIAMREDDGMLFVVSPSDGGVVYAIDTTVAPAEAQVWHRDAGRPNGLIIGPNGVPYYSDFGSGHVYRVDAQDQVTRITSSPVPSANGLMFDDDGTLLVLAYREGRVYRLTLDDQGIEQARVRAHTVNGAALDGIAKDTAGRIYLSDNGNGQLLRFDANFGNPETLLRNVPAAANIAFGQGVLDCNVAYVASSGTLGSVALD